VDDDRNPSRKLRRRYSGLLQRVSQLGKLCARSRQGLLKIDLVTRCGPQVSIADYHKRRALSTWTIRPWLTCN
jgi:hypothetical protein